MATTMKTNYSIELTDAQLLALGLRITGKNQRATRKQIVEWLDTLVQRDLTGKAPKTEMRNMVCPKCSRPIAVSVPVVTQPPQSPQPTLDQPFTATGAIPAELAKQLEASATESARALDKLAANIRKASA